MGNSFHMFLDNNKMVFLFVIWISVLILGVGYLFSLRNSDNNVKKSSGELENVLSLEKSISMDTMPKECIKPVKPKLSDLEVGDSAKISPAVICLDMNGKAWLWVGMHADVCESDSLLSDGQVIVTKCKDGWIAKLKNNMYQWTIGDREKYKCLSYEPITKLEFEQ